MDACLNDSAMAEALVAQFETNMATPMASKARRRSSSTATSIRNMSYDDLKAILDAEAGG